MFRSVLSIALAALLVLPAASQPAGDLMLEREIKVRNGGLLFVNVGDADLELRAGEGGMANVEIYLRGRDMDKAREYYEARNYQVSETSNGLEITSDKLDWRRWNWNNRGRAQVSIRVTIPTEFNLEVSTSDGDISADSFEGNAFLKSSDGDLVLNNLTGEDINIRTSDGDVRAASLDAPDIVVRTSDGDIHVDDVVAERAEIRTSDGDIWVADIIAESYIQSSDGDIVLDTVTGKAFQAKTSDGNISVGEISCPSSRFSSSDGDIIVREASGDLYATTSDGDIDVALLSPGEIELKTSDGDIAISAPAEMSANIELRGDEVRLSRGYEFDGEIKKRTASGLINGGGKTISARASDGTVRLATRSQD